MAHDMTIQETSVKMLTPTTSSHSRLVTIPFPCASSFSQITTGSTNGVAGMMNA